MTLIRHELKQGRKSLAVWTLSIGFFIAVCIFLYPEMKGEMEDVGDLFSSMGAFTAAFGMDRLNFGTLKGFYAVECGNILGIGGAFFASLIGITALSKEEKEKTAEFLLTHPVSRDRIVAEKLAAVVLMLIIMNAAVFGMAVLSVVLIDEPVPFRDLCLLHGAGFLMQLELACLCFGISAFLRRSGAGIGLGLASALYFLNLVANLSEDASFLKYFTPFGFADGADLLAEGHMDTGVLTVGMLLALAGTIAAFLKYRSKDIH